MAHHRQRVPSSWYQVFDREEWASLREHHPMSLEESDLIRLRGVGETIDLTEVEEVYLPLSRLLCFYVEAVGALHQVTSNFLGERPDRTPFIIGIAGSVAVGKSTTARVLRELLLRWPDSPHVDLVTTDGFLYPNHELTRRGLLRRKGFPESYDQRALLKFLGEVKSGAECVTAPVYSHVAYDIVPDERVEVKRPSVLIVEGLNVLQSARVRQDGRVGLAVSDFFDFTIYVDAWMGHIRQWYIERFLRLRETAFARSDSYFNKYASLSDQEARTVASEIWSSINEPNLTRNVLPTRGRASLILTKGSDHKVKRVNLRKL